VSITFITAMVFAVMCVVPLVLYSQQNYYLWNLQMGPISYSVTLNKSEKICQGQALKLIGPIHKLQRKSSVVNTAPESHCAESHYA
jgi:hypothetical protein